MSDIDAPEIFNFLISVGVVDDSVQLEGDESLFDADILDSLRLIDVVSELETRYGIKIKQADLTPSNFDSLNGIAQLVNIRVATS